MGRLERHPIIQLFGPDFMVRDQTCKKKFAIKPACRG